MGRPRKRDQKTTAVEQITVSTTTETDQSNIGIEAPSKANVPEIDCPEKSFKTEPINEECSKTTSRAKSDSTLSLPSDESAPLDCEMGSMLPIEESTKCVKRKAKNAIPSEPKSKKSAVKKPVQDEISEEQKEQERIHNKRLRQIYTKNKATVAEEVDLPDDLNGMSTDPLVQERQCEKCYQIFKNRDKLNRHIMSHSEEVQTSCCYCNAPIKYKYNLKNHMMKCQKRKKASLEDTDILNHYPQFLEELERAMEDVKAPIPKLPPMYKMDKHGFVTGWDPTLNYSLDMMLPTSTKRYCDPKKNNAPSNDVRKCRKRYREVEEETVDYEESDSEGDD